MKYKLIFGLCIVMLLVSGCYSPIPREESVTQEQNNNKNEVFVKVNYPVGQIVSRVRCYDSDYDEITYFNYSFIGYADYYTVEEETDHTIYRIRQMNLIEYFNIVRDKTFKKHLGGLSSQDIYDIECKTDLITPENNIVIEMWDEGYNEERRIDLFYKVDILCEYDFHYEQWECKYYDSDHFEINSVAYLLEDKIIEYVIDLNK